MNILHNLQPVADEACPRAGVVGQEANFGDAEIAQDLSAHAKILFLPRLVFSPNALYAGLLGENTKQGGKCLDTK